MDTLMQDVRFALRQLRKSPGFTLTVVVTLALGIGANAAIFTLFDQALLRMLPVERPKELVRFEWTGGYNGSASSFGGDIDNYFSYPMYQDLKAKNQVFTDILATDRVGAGLSWHNQAEARDGETVSGNYFEVLGLHPAAGRLFTDADDQKGAPITAVMSYDTWQQDYAGDPSIIGSAFFINTKPATIIGIAPKGFYGDRIDTNPPKYFLPMNSMDQVIGAPYFTDPDSQWAYIIGRVKPGTSLSTLQTKASTLLKQQFAPLKTFTDQRAQKVLPLTHVVLTP